MTKHVLKTCGEDVQGTRQALRPSSHIDPHQHFAGLDVEAGQGDLRTVYSLGAIDQDQHGSGAPMASRRSNDSQVNSNYFALYGTEMNKRRS